MNSSNTNGPAEYPLVSIGLPVFNDEKSIKNSIQAIIDQSFQNWELIISDNNSSDETLKIIKECVKFDDRIFFYKQEINIGMYPNFEFVLNKSKGQYFHWLGSDDSRSANFLEDNISFLEEHPDFVASCSSKYFGAIDKIQNNNINFSLDQDLAYKRINWLLTNIWQSHSIYYSVVRTSIIKQCQFLGEHFLSQDWIVDIHMAKHGKIALQNNSYIIIGESGISKVNPYKPFRVIWIEFIVPLYTFHKKFNKLTSNFDFKSKVKLQVKMALIHSIITRIRFMRSLRKILRKLIKDKVRAIYQKWNQILIK